ncbi:hypothetical protein [Flavobacterium sp. F52]|uniref:hypothetical protein n=1 Tax=Flavobacterium sp. F52 TaxID=1202532 RepID=UPI0012F9B8F9|nr:hypothetical protein [Flavobacterium sp. F52]
MVISSNLIFSQNKKCNDNRPFLVTLNDPLVAYYSINKDTSMVSISFYVNGYESKQKRDKAIKARQDQWNKQKRRDYVRLPTFSVNYFDIGKPEKLITLGYDYQTLNEFKGVPSRICIIVRQDDGSYLKWSPIIFPEE